MYLFLPSSWLLRLCIALHFTRSPGYRLSLVRCIFYMSSYWLFRLCIALHFTRSHRSRRSCTNAHWSVLSIKLWIFICCLDHAGSTLYAQSQIQTVMHNLMQNFRSLIKNIINPFPFRLTSGWGGKGNICLIWSTRLSCLRKFLFFYMLLFKFNQLEYCAPWPAVHSSSNFLVYIYNALCCNILSFVHFRELLDAKTLVWKFAILF